MAGKNGYHKRRDLVRQQALPIGSQGIVKWPETYREGLAAMMQDAYTRIVVVGNGGNLEQFKGTLNYLGIDLETEDLNPYNPNALIRSIAVSPRPGYAYPFVFAHQGEVLSQQNFNILIKILTDPAVTLIGHNIKYDLNWLAVKLGMKISCRIFDTLFAEYLLDENNPEGNSLKELTRRYLKEETRFKDHKDEVNVKHLDVTPKNDVLVYNAKDADAARTLMPILLERLTQENLLPLCRLGNDVIKTLHRMEVRGIYLDKEWANKQQVKLFSELVAAKVGIEKESGTSVDPGKPNQLKNLLYTRWGYQCTKYTDAGGLSTDAEAIQGVIDQINLDPSHEDAEKNAMHFATLEHIKKYKDNIHLINNFYEPIKYWTADDGRVHATYNLGNRRTADSRGGTVTGRLSCTDPNLQQIPISSDVRGMFCATPGYVYLDGDYSQLELRVCAAITQEPVLVEAFANNKDIHTAVMGDILGMEYDELCLILGNDAMGIPANKEHPKYKELKVLRVAIKRLNFGILYGIEAERLQKLLKLDMNVWWPIEKCKDLKVKWLEKHKRVDQWIKSIRVQAATQQFVSMPLGQKRRLPEASFETAEGRRALRQGGNFPIQSYASWICLTGLTLLDKFFDTAPFEGGLILQVHDSIGAEVEKQFFEKQSRYTLEDLKRQVQFIMEKGTVESLKANFGVDFNIPLSFPVSIGERWS